MKWEKEKPLLACVYIAGIIAVAYGMSKENDVIFILGLLFIIAGYLLIRRKLKAHVKKPYHL
jgi:LPXTG-motif cell wall-anchored protein